MNKLRNIILVVVIALFVNSCAKPEDPNPVQVAMGEWRVENVIANGEVNIDNVFGINSILHLDQNESFLFVNVDGRASSGTWSSTETTLTLNGDDGYVQTFTIVYLDWGKMHVQRTLSIAQGSDIELRYLFRRI